MMCVLASLRSWTRHLRAIQFSFPPNQSAPFHLGLYSSTTSARPIPFMPFLLHLATIHAASHQTIFIIDHTRIFSSVFSISSHPIPNQTTSLPPRMTYLYNYHSRTTRHHQRGRQLSFRPTPRRQRCTSSLVVLVHPPPPAQASSQQGESKSIMASCIPNSTSIGPFHIPLAYTLFSVNEPERRAAGAIEVVVHFNPSRVRGRLLATSSPAMRELDRAPQHRPCLSFVVDRRWSPLPVARRHCVIGVQ